MKALRKLLGSEKMTVIADQLVFSGTAFAITLLMAKLLNQKEFGLFSGLMLGVYLLLSLSNAIVIQPLQVSLFKVNSTTKYLTFTLMLLIALLAIIGILMYISLQFSFAIQISNYSMPAVLFALSFLLHDFFRKSYLASGKIQQTLLIDFVNCGLQFIFILINSEKGESTLYNTLLLLGLAYLPTNIICLLRWNYNLPLTAELKEFLHLNFNQGSWMILVSILQWTSTNFFSMVSGIYIGLEALGAFRLVQSIFGVLNILLQTFENYVLPKASRLYMQNKQHSKDYLKKITWQGGFLFAPVLLLLAIFSENVMRLCGGEKYVEYNYVIKLMTVLYSIIYLGYPVRMGIRLLVVNRSFFTGYLISFIFSLFSFQYLLSHGNLTGAVTGLAINQLIMLTYWQYTLKLKNFSIWK